MINQTCTFDNTVKMAYKFRLSKWHPSSFKPNFNNDKVHEIYNKRKWPNNVTTSLFMVIDKTSEYVAKTNTLCLNSMKVQCS